MLKAFVKVVLDVQRIFYSDKYKIILDFRYVYQDINVILNNLVTRSSSIHLRLDIEPQLLVGSYFSDIGLYWSV